VSVNNEHDDIRCRHARRTNVWLVYSDELLYSITQIDRMDLQDDCK